MVPKVVLHQVYFNSAHLGQTLRQIALPDGCYVLGLIRDSHVMMVCEDPILQEQDWLIAVTPKEALAPELQLCLGKVQVQS